MEAWLANPSLMSADPDAEYVDITYAAIQAQMPEVTVYDLKEKIIRALKRRHLLCYHQERNSFYLHPLFQEKAAILLNQNPDNVRSAHRQAYRYFSKNLNFPETPLKLTSIEGQNLEYIKSILRSHYHASLAEDREIAQQLMTQFSQIWQSCPPQFQATIQDYLDDSSSFNQETGFLRQFRQPSRDVKKETRLSVPPPLYYWRLGATTSGFLIY